MFQLCRGREDNICVIHGVGGELLVDDGEQVVAHQAGDHPALVGADGGGVAVVDVERPDRRPGQLAGQRLGEPVHVDGPRPRGDQVGPGQLLHREVVQAAGRQERPAAVVPPGPDERGEARDRPDGHPTAAVPLESVVEPDQARMLGCVPPGQLLDRRGVDPGDVRDPVDGILGQHPGLERRGADRRPVEVVPVNQPVAPEDVHQAQGQCSVGARPGLDVPVTPRGGRAPERVDRHQRRPGLPGLDHPAPQVAVGVDGVRSPVDDEPALLGRHRVGAEPAAPDGVLVPLRPGRGADRPVQQTRPEPVEEPAVEAARLELAHRPVIAIRKDRLRAVGRVGDGAELGGDPPERLVPRDRLESPLPLAADAEERRLEAGRAVDPVEVAGHLPAEEAAGERVVLVAPEVDRHAVADRHPHRAGVGAVQRADRLHHPSRSVRHGEPPPVRSPSPIALGDGPIIPVAARREELADESRLPGDGANH